LVLPAIVLIVGAIFRFYNLNWDDGHQLHPDEREIYMVVSGASGNPPLGLPTSWLDFLSVKDPSGGSPLNPHFFSYGSLPFYLLAAVSTVIAFLGQHVPGLGAWADANTYGNLPNIGRPLSALLDMASVGLIFLLGRRVFGYWTGVLAMALVAFTVLDIQLAHFYAVDTVLLPLVLLTLLGAMSIIRRGSAWAYAWTGIALGAALATKTTALLLVIPIGAAAVLAAWNVERWAASGSLWQRLWSHYSRTAKPMNRNLQWTLGAFVVAAATFAVFEPYALLDRAQLLHDISAQTVFLVNNNPPFSVPFTIQYAGTTPYLFQFQNLLFWCLGIPLGLAAFIGVAVFLVRAVRLRISAEQLLLLLWVVAYFLFVGRFFAKFNRYMLPITPVMTLLGAAVMVWLASRVSLRVRSMGWATIAVVLLVSFGYSLAYMNIYAHANTRVASSTWIYGHIPAGTRIAVEAPWDDTLPLPMGAQSPSQYPNQINLALYNNECDDSGTCARSDVTSKLSNIADALVHAKYITMSSERLVGSIPKLPRRYPIAIRYYHLLFSNRLNFRLIKVYQQHPQLGPIVVHDYPADESFHVYDHPIVRIFERVRPISTAQAVSLLTPPILRRGGTSSIPLPLNPAPDRRLMLSAKQWAKDQQGQTYDQMFPPTGLAMQHPVLIWWLLLELLGIIAFPLVFVVFSGLRDRGFIVAKTVGLLLLGWIVWITVSLGLTTYDRAFMYGLVVVLTALSAALGYRLRERILPFVREHWRRLLVAEVLFLAVFAIGLFLRAWYPDLGHQYSPVSATNNGGGRMGEKQMELAYLNAVVRSRVFPPFDPFFAHGYINYYYYGFFLVGTLCKLAQISPAMGFNLAVATFFALLLGTTYSIVSTLTRRITPGVLAAVMVGLIGNLNGAWQLIRNLMAVATVHSSTPLFGGIADVGSGLKQAVANHAPLPQVDFWESTRILPPVGQSIAEFPYFTYLFADLHPHLIAYPITAAAIAFAVCLARTRYRGPERVAAVLTGALILGAIAVVNPWDFPTYLMLAGIGALVGSYFAIRHLSVRLLIRPSAWVVSLGILSSVAYLPFKLGYQTVFQTGLGLTRDITPQLLGPDVTASDAHDILVTPLRLYLEHFGLFLFVILSYLLLLLLRDAGLARAVKRWGLFLRFAVYYRDRLMRVVHAGRSARRMLAAQEPILDPSLVAGFVILAGGLAILGYYLLGFLIAVAGLVFLLLLRLGHRLSRTEIFACVLLFVPLALSAGTQIFFIKDFLAGGSAFRMNTIFKFYNESWVLYAICAATMAYAFMDRVLAPAPAPSRAPSPAASVADGDGHAETADSSLEMLQVQERVVERVGAGHTSLPFGERAAEHLWEPVEDGDGEAVPTVDLTPVEPEASAVLPGNSSNTPPWRRPVALLNRYPIWTLCFTALLLGSLIYTFGGTINREDYRTAWLPENSVPRTLDGMAFMKVAYPQDYAGIQWLNAHVGGAQVLAEAHSASLGYTWPSRVSMFTGLPTIINGIHEGEQRFSDEMNPAQDCSKTRDPGPCTTRLPSRDDDLATLYNSPRPSDAWRVIHKYGVRYIFVGFSETHCSDAVCYSKAGTDKFNRMVGHGLKLAFQHPGVKIYQVLA
jgi:YYY domain-containing protein